MKISGQVGLYSVISILVAILYASTSHAINYAAGAKLSDGLVLNLYPYYYRAEIRTDKHGDSTTQNLGLHKYGMTIGASYYLKNFLFNVVIPNGNLEVHSLRAENGGIGDIQLRTGYFLPIDSVTILPLLLIKTPTGNFDRSRSVNFGDGQPDLAAEIYLRKLAGPVSLDALLKYAVRFRNPYNDLTPGNEFITELLATWRFTEHFWAGPALNITVGSDNKRNGRIVTDSGLTKLAAGGELYYRGFSRVKLSLAAYQDVSTRNTTEGLMLLSRIVLPF